MKNLIYLLGFSFLIFISCNKKNDLEYEPEVKFENDQYHLNQVSLRSTQILVNPSNENNPIDSVGQIHNVILDEIAFHSGFDTFDISDIISTAYDYVNFELGWGDQGQLISFQMTDSIVTSIWEFCLDDDIEGAIDFIASNWNLSLSLSYELNELFSVLSYEREYVDITSLLDSIIAKENNFPHSFFSTREQLIYYGTASVLRYSASYWDIVIDDETMSHPYYYIMGDLLAHFDDNLNDAEIRKWNWKRFWRNVATIAGDALGFAAGSAFVSWTTPACPACPVGAGTLVGTATSGAVGSMFD